MKKLFWKIFFFRNPEKASPHHKTKASSLTLKLFIPNRDKHGRPIHKTKHKKWIDYFTLQLSKTFGGCYIETVKSYYMTDNQIIIEETTNIINACCFEDSFNANDIEQLTTALKEYGVDTLQETILYEINRTSYLLPI